MSSNQNSHISQTKWDICSRHLIVFDVCNVTNCILLDYLLVRVTLRVRLFRGIFCSSTWLSLPISTAFTNHFRDREPLKDFSYFF